MNVLEIPLDHLPLSFPVTKRILPRRCRRETEIIARLLHDRFHLESFAHHGEVCGCREEGSGDSLNPISFRVFRQRNFEYRQKL
jgi:hypothetical protein